MLYDTRSIRGPVPGTIPAEQAYEMAQLHAKMMTALKSTDWSVGQARDIWVCNRAITRKERRERGIANRTEKVFIREHAITSFPDLMFTRSGAVYSGTMVGSPSGLVTGGPEELVTFATLASDDAYDITRAMNAIIEHCYGVDRRDTPQSATIA